MAEARHPEPPGQPILRMISPGPTTHEGRTTMSKPFSEAGGMPVNDAQPVMTYSPVVFDVPGRPVPLAMKVSMPESGTDLPIILVSHGHGMTNFLSSLNGYGPIVNFFAAHGFAVIQPTHL